MILAFNRTPGTTFYGVPWSTIRYRHVQVQLRPAPPEAAEAEPQQKHGKHRQRQGEHQQTQISGDWRSSADFCDVILQGGLCGENVRVNYPLQAVASCSELLSCDHAAT